MSTRIITKEFTGGEARGSPASPLGYRPERSKSLQADFRTFSIKEIDRDRPGNRETFAYVRPWIRLVFKLFVIIVERSLRCALVVIGAIGIARTYAKKLVTQKYVVERERNMRPQRRPRRIIGSGSRDFETDKKIASRMELAA